MFEDDEKGRPAGQTFDPAAGLAEWSEEALRRYIQVLRAEILRAEIAIEARMGHRAAADAFFRKPD